MLNKDQYNQDEYNDYYKQETEGAEITGNYDDNGGFLKKLILFLGLIALGIAGYFGFKIFNNTNTTITKEKLVIKEETPKSIEAEVHSGKTIEDKVIETIENNKDKIDRVAINSEKTAKELKERTKAVEDKIEKTIQEEVATQVQEKLEKNKKMSTEDISKIVDIVMNKMEKEKVKTQKTNQNNDLVSALEKSEHNIVETKAKETETLTTNTVSTVKKDTVSTNTNNKVTLDSSSKNDDTDLDKLSKQIKKLLNMAGESDKPRKVVSDKITTTEINTPTNNTHVTNYEDSISKEIEVRTNEMRIIVVKPGDTLNKIAKRAYGDVSSYQKIFDANPDISKADKIYVGQKLRIPE